MPEIPSSMFFLISLNIFTFEDFFIANGMITSSVLWIKQYIDLSQPKSVAPGPGCSEPD